VGPIQAVERIGSLEGVVVGHDLIPWWLSAGAAGMVIRRPAWRGWRFGLTEGEAAEASRSATHRPIYKPENYQGIRLYWAPADIKALRERLLQLGYSISEIVDRDYGQTEFFVTDDDGHSHCFGVATDMSGEHRRSYPERKVGLSKARRRKPE
jgi:hypothetical protein